MSRKLIDIEAILNDLYASEINVSISWLWGSGIQVKLGDEMNGIKAEEAFQGAEGIGAAVNWLLRGSIAPLSTEHLR